MSTPFKWKKIWRTICVLKATPFVEEPECMMRYCPELQIDLFKNLALDNPAR